MLPILLAFFCAIAAAQDDTASLRVLDAGLRLAEPALRTTPCSDLTIRDGRVAAASIIDEITGYAKAAGTTGGLGGPLIEVTSAEDYNPQKHEAVIPGTLRAAIAKSPAWIVFKVSKITLKASLRLPDNITLDGSCSGIVIESPVNVGQAEIFSTKNVIIYRMAFHKTGYQSTADEGDAESCIRLNGLFDRVAILHNHLSECGDGCIDITTSPRKPLPDIARVTVAYNRIENHDKTMLFGTFTCGEKGLPACDAAYVKANRDSEPAFRMTLVGNLFMRTAQRHPRVFGHVMADIVNNVFAIAAMPRADGSFSDAYSIFVSNAARALVEQNAFVPLSKKWGTHRAVWTTTTRGASRMPEDTVGFIRLGPNISTSKVVMGENEPSMVTEPEYRKQLRVLSFDKMTPERAVACIAARAGIHGGRDWDAALCAPTQP